MLRRLALPGAALLVSASLLAGCGDSKPAEPTGQLASVSVTGEDPKTAPKVELKKKPIPLTKTESNVLTEGKGPEVAKDSIVSMDAVVVNGKDGKVLDSTYGKTPVGVDLTAQQLFPSLKSELPGKKVGSRVLIGSTPKDAFGEQGAQQYGLGANDPVVFVVDIRGVTSALKEATGKAVAPKPGLPTVKVNPGKAATITTPKGAKAPTSLVVQPLIEGTGPVVKKGQTLRANYTGVIWGTNKKFDSSADNPEQPYAEFPIGVGKVIPGWDKGLVGQKVGSRVLLVIPPKEGYGAQGSNGIKGTDTLIFSVDILASY